MVKTNIPHLYTQINSFVDTILSHRIIFFCSYISLNPDNLFLFRKKLHDNGFQLMLINSRFFSYGFFKEIDFLFQKSTAIIYPFLQIELTSDKLVEVLSLITDAAFKVSVIKQSIFFFDNIESLEKIINSISKEMMFKNLYSILNKNIYEIVFLFKNLIKVVSSLTECIFLIKRLSLLNKN